MYTVLVGGKGRNVEADVLVGERSIHDEQLPFGEH